MVLPDSLGNIRELETLPQPVGGSSRPDRAAVRFSRWSHDSLGH